MDRFQNKYKIKSNRLRGFDYGTSAGYFVTICTKNKNPYFGHITGTGNGNNETGNGPSLRASKIGEIAIEYWKEIPNHYPFVTLDAFVLMPDHLHGILFLNSEGHTVSQPGTFGIQSMNLGAVIRAFKSSVKRQCNQKQMPFAWQPGYYDHIIRKGKDLMNIRQYIIDNPAKWIYPQQFIHRQGKYFI